MAFARPRANGKVSWYAKFKDLSGVWQEEKAFPNTKRDAERLEARREREVRDGSYVKGGTPTDALSVASYSKAWLAKRANKTKLDDDQRLRDYVLPALGERRLRELRSIECIDFVRGLVRRGINPKTVSNIWGVLRTMLRDAYIEEIVSFSPVMPRGVIPARQSTIHEIYDDDSVQRLIWSSTADVWMDLFCWIAFCTGMREGEICGLRWSDWTDDEDLSSRRFGSLLVSRQYGGLGDDSTTKTCRSRLVPVHPDLAVRLRAVKASLGGVVTGPIVPRPNGMHHTKATAYKAFVRHCDAVGVESLGIHRTRHTAITAMRRRGVPQAEVERVTHNSAGTIVDRYTHDWTILCAAVACIDVQSRGVSRGALPEMSNESGGGAGNRTRVSTRQITTCPDNARQTEKSVTCTGGQKTNLTPRRGALHEITDLGSVRLRASRSSCQVVPLIDDSRRVVGWVPVTDAEVDDDLRPRPYEPPSRPRLPITYWRIRRAAESFADRFGGASW